MLDGTALYLGKLERTPTFSHTADDDSHNEGGRRPKMCDGPTLRKKMAAVKGLYIKMHHELAMAKREIAWGKLRARDINAVSDLCRRILMPL